MVNQRFSRILNQWEENRRQRQQLVSTEIQMSRSDRAKLEALAEVYDQPIERVMADLVHSALLEVESSIPYVPGAKIIRIEDGDPCYEDEGKMPLYLEARQRKASSAS
ncbi:hypothetical protein BGP77_01600 [Saccharospirillum sp. MSK14-1]|uniref:hypothetical protein n=1 Tax=Saccharospirillum sp. MSK14-1 TaxID=1897632 RepID=UPI000D3A00A9|nr:hypothetical protein [Saccharospirillum sp. MSK14-1]PTY36043.1 hypothetical protein BGP77_01600 [Saccharospirillum sp. MSK14-1]